MRRTLLILSCASLLGGMQGCAGTAREAASHATSYAKSVATCVAEKIAACAAPPLDQWCPDCQRFLDKAKGKD